MKIKNYILTLTALLFSLSIAAQSNRNRTLINAALHGWEYEIRAGFNIGGTLPQPFPEEIRSIDSYTPTLSVSIEGNQMVRSKATMGNHYRHPLGKQRNAHQSNCKKLWYGNHRQ